MAIWQNLFTRGAADDAAWRRFAVWLLTVFGGGIAIIYLALIVIDPYDTGRFPTFMPAGIPDEHQQVNSASRGRNPAFNAAIFGNSHGQLLSPQRLSAQTGMRFVQMTSPGSGPREQLTFMRYFLRHHPDTQGIVLAADERWCTHDAALPALFQFSPWLYESNFQYLTHILSTRAIVAARKRVMMALGKLPAYDPAGYWDYETGKPWNFHPGTDDKPLRAIDTSTDVNRFFPALEALDTFTATLPASLPIVIVMPPQSSQMLPETGTVAANELAVCKEAIARRVQERGRGVFLDYLVDGPRARDPQNFMDRDHYRLPIAREIETAIASALRAANPQQSPPRATPSPPAR